MTERLNIRSAGLHENELNRQRERGKKKPPNISIITNVAHLLSSCALKAALSAFRCVADGHQARTVNTRKTRKFIRRLQVLMMPAGSVRVEPAEEEEGEGVVVVRREARGAPVRMRSTTSHTQTHTREEEGGVGWWLVEGGDGDDDNRSKQFTVDLRGGRDDEEVEEEGEEQASAAGVQRGEAAGCHLWSGAVKKLFLPQHKTFGSHSSLRWRRRR